VEFIKIGNFYNLFLDLIKLKSKSILEYFYEKFS